MPLEQVAVDVGKPREVFVERRRPFVLRRVQHLEQQRQPGTEIGPVLPRPCLDELEEDVARLEYPRVVGEHAEHHPDEKPLQIVAAVARVGERIVQAPHQLRGLDVRRILIAEGPALNAEDEAERLDVRGQVRQCKRDGFSLVEVAKFEGLEVADQNVARAVAFGQRVEILLRLLASERQVAPRALLLDDQYAGPE